MKRFSHYVLHTFVIGLVIQSSTIAPSFSKTPIRSKQAAQSLTLIEPSYCDPALFDEKEISLGPNYEEQQKKNLFRLHGYQLGKVKLIGVGVGDSSSASLIEVAKQNTNESVHKSL